jgi:hypothetical protein
MRRPSLLLSAALAVGLCLPARAQTYEVIHVFLGTDGSSPLGTLLPVGTDFYGTTRGQMAVFVTKTFGLK